MLLKYICRWNLEIQESCRNFKSPTLTRHKKVLYKLYVIDA